MLRNAHGTGAPPLGPRSRADLQAHDVGSARRRRARDPRGRGLANRSPRRPRGARERDRTGRAARYAGPGRGHRPAARTHATIRHGLRTGTGAGNAAAPSAHRAVPRRGNASGARGAQGRTPGTARHREPRPLPLRDRVHATSTPARPRSTGRRRRGNTARAEPVLGGRPGALRRGRPPPPHGAATALRAHA